MVIHWFDEDQGRISLSGLTQDILVAVYSSVTFHING